MKIQFCSDLHLEFPENKKYIRENPIIPKSEILILAGDIVPFNELAKHHDFFDYLSDNFMFVYWIAGNHEYYHADILKRRGEFREEIRHNVFLVNNTWVHHENVKIIFSTLWSSISPKNAWAIETQLNDFNYIKAGEKRFSTQLYNTLHNENLEFIKNAVAKNEKEKCIVVTHHVPTLINYPLEYVGSSINEAFAVDLNHFIEQASIDYWIFGHHHRNIADFKIGATTLCTNQLGYVKYNENHFFNNERCLSL